jgi:excisionase family DNA binding protein
MIEEQRELLSTLDLASYLGVPVTTLYGWRYKGEGPRASKVGRHLRYRRIDVEAWLDDRGRTDKR